MVDYRAFNLSLSPSQNKCISTFFLIKSNNVKFDQVYIEEYHHLWREICKLLKYILYWIQWYLFCIINIYCFNTNLVKFGMTVLDQKLKAHLFCDKGVWCCFRSSVSINIHVFWVIISTNQAVHVWYSCLMSWTENLSTCATIGDYSTFLYLWEG